MSAALTILLEDAGGAMPSNPVGPPARQPGESAVPGKPAKKDGGKELDDPVGDQLRKVGKDLLAWIGLDKIADIGSRMKDTFEGVRDLVRELGQKATIPDEPRPSSVPSVPRPEPDAPRAPQPPRTPSVPPANDDRRLTPSVPPRSPTLGSELAKPVAHWPRETPGPPTATPSRVVGPPAGAARVVGPAAGGEGAAGAIASITAAVGPAAIAIGAFTVAAVAGGFAIKKAFDALSAEVGKLQNYSAPVAAAQGRNEVRAEMSLVRRGEEIGPQLGKFADDMGKFQEAQAEFYTQILKVLLLGYEAVRPVVDVLTRMIQLSASGVEINKAGFDSVVAALTVGNRADDFKAAADMAKALTKFGAILERLNDESGGGDSIDPLMTQLLSGFGPMPGGPSAPAGSPRSRRPLPPFTPPGLIATGRGLAFGP